MNMRARGRKHMPNIKPNEIYFASQRKQNEEKEEIRQKAEDKVSRIKITKRTNQPR